MRQYEQDQRRYEAEREVVRNSRKHRMDYRMTDSILRFVANGGNVQDLPTFARNHIYGKRPY